MVYYNVNHKKKQYMQNKPKYPHTVSTEDPQFMWGEQTDLLFIISSAVIMSSCLSVLFSFVVSLSFTTAGLNASSCAELRHKTDHKGFERQLSWAAIHIYKSGNLGEEGGNTLMASNVVIYNKQPKRDKCVAFIHI